MAFPSSPTGGQQYTQDGRTWQWDGVAWEVLAVPGPTGPAGVVAATAPLAYNSGTQTVSIDLSAYSTTAAANGLYYPLSGNPSSFLTASALTPYLTSATAASTYAALAGATFTNVVGFNGNPGNVSAKSTGYFKAYTSGFENTDYSLQYESGFQVVIGGTTVARIAASGILAPSAGITFSDATTQTSAGITAATAASTYQTLSGMSSYLTTATAASTYQTLSGMSSYLTSATAASTYQTLSGMSSYLTSATAASTYFTIASAANKADLASPTFSGTPSLPTGTIAVTQSPGNNTTAVATTAFVLAATPAASTTVVGLVELATSEEAILGASTTLAPTAFAGKAAIMSSDWSPIYRNGFTATVSGTGANSTLGFTNTLYQMPTLGAVAGHSYGRTFGTSQIDQLTNMWGDDANIYVNFAKRIWISGRSLLNFPNEAVYVARVSFGKAEATGVGDLAARGIGWKYIAGASNFVQLMVHNGTTLTTVNSSFHPTTSAFSWDIVSDGSGNVTLYINGSSVATTASGPSTRAVSTQCLYQEEAVLTATSTGNFLRFYCARGAIYVQR